MSVKDSSTQVMVLTQHHLLVSQSLINVLAGSCKSDWSE